MNRAVGEGLPDFVLMDQITEEALMENLKLRYSKDRIYTYIGEVVVSVNPYKKMDSLYNAATINEYRGRQMYEVPPHIFSLSNDVHRNLMRNKANQCVIISGESGAGKTEASKVFMQYIAAVSKSSTEVDRVKNQLLESNPILEAFGNSKTLRNDNSSRFGKYMEIQFEHDGSPVGGKISNFLLEKSRVVIRNKGERSFHIFYQMLEGMTQDELSKLKLEKDPLKYNYLKSSESVKVDTINDNADWKIVQKALNTLKFADKDRNSMWKVLAGILLLGNVTFSEVPGRSSQAKVESTSVVEQICSLWEIGGASVLTGVLTSRSITTGVGKRSSHINIPLDVNAAIFTRDALAKSLYERLFNWIVEHINSSLSCKSPGQKLLIGVLDIYGFEVLQNNSFEQFCINLCNEKLQQLFIELTLKSEQEEYVREGIKWEPIKYFNNKIICDLIEGVPGQPKTVSIISMMDETSLIGESTDSTLLAKLVTNFGKHPHFETYSSNKDRTIGDNCFRLKHYAGNVSYNVDGFLEKNKDTLFADLVLCMQGSNDELIKSLYSSFDIHSKKRPLSAATQFKNALAALMEKLLACQPHYIRCIKPNEQKKPNQLDEALVRHQVRYLGLLENVRVRRAGFAYRQEYDRFVRRYKMICKETWPNTKNGTQQSHTEKIMKSLNFKEEGFRFGKTKIFIREPTTLFKLEEVREAVLPKVVTKMQAAWRGYIARKKLKQRKAAIKIQSAWKGYNARKKWNKRKNAMKILMRYRKWKADKWLRQVIAAFSNVASDPKLGKNIAWPEAKSMLKYASSLVKKIHLTWRARKMIKSLNEAQTAEMKQKILTYDIFKGKKPWNCSRKFEADYLEMDSNPNKEKYIQGMQNLFKVYQDTEVLFADYADKINHKSKPQRRAVVVTNKSIYKQDPKNYKVKKCEIPLSQVEAICLSPHSDTFVVVQAKEPYRDLLADFGVNNVERYSEFVAVVVEEVKKLMDVNVEVKFIDNIKYNNGRIANKSPGVNCTLTFQQDPKVTTSTFKAGKNNANVILYK